MSSKIKRKLSLRNGHTDTLFLKVRKRTREKAVSGNPSCVDSPLPVEAAARRQLVSLPRVVSVTPAARVAGELRTSLTRRKTL